MWATTGDFHGTISAQHTSCRFIDTEKILTEIEYTFAEMIEENERTLDGEIDMNWNKKRFWDIRTELNEDELVDAQTEIETTEFRDTRTELNEDELVDTQREIEMDEFWDTRTEIMRMSYSLLRQN